MVANEEYTPCSEDGQTLSRYRHQQQQFAEMRRLDSRPQFAYIPQQFAVVMLFSYYLNIFPPDNLIFYIAIKFSLLIFSQLCQHKFN